MKHISHVLGLVVLNTYRWDHTLLQLLQWDINTCRLSPELAPGNSSASPGSTKDSSGSACAVQRDKAVIRMTCHLLHHGVLEFQGIQPK